MRTRPPEYEVCRRIAEERKIPLRTVCQEVARRLGMNIAAVYKAKSNVMKLLQEEVQILEESEFS